MQVNTLRIRKSVKLTADEMKMFKKWLGKYNTHTDAAEELGINRPTIGRILMSGGGHQVTIEKVRKALDQTS